MPLNALRLEVRARHVGTEGSQQEMGIVKRSVSEGGRIALVQNMQDNVKISKDKEPGCISQESCRWACPDQPACWASERESENHLLVPR